MSAAPSPGQQSAATGRWWPTHPASSDRRSARHGLADEARELLRLVSQLETESCDLDTLAAAKARMAEVRDLLASLPDLSSHGGACSAPGDDANLFERSPVSGWANPLAAPLQLEFDGETTYGHAVYHDAYEGPPGNVHGGVIMAAFDELLGVAQAASGLAGFTGTLTVRMRRPTPLHQRIDYEAGVESVEGRKIIAVGRASHGAELLAEATGIFIAPRQSEVARAAGMPTDG